MSRIGCGLTLALLLLVAAPGWAATITVPTGANPIVNGQNFQAAIGSAALGDTIVLQAGAIYFSAGGFQFGFKPGGTGTDADYITVQSSTMGACPAEGVRVDPPTHIGAMPKLLGSGPPVISVNANAHHWKFVCLEVTNDQNNLSTSLITTANNGSAGGGYPTYAEVYATHHIIFDRMFIHNPEVTAGNLHPQALEIWATRGMGLTGANISVLNSWIGSFAGWYPGTTVLSDAYGIFGGSGGPMLIQNNRIEAFFNNIFWAAASTNPAHTATVSSPTLTSATFSAVTGLNVGDYVALRVPDGTAGCQTDFNNPTCWQAVVVDAISGLNVTYHGIGPGHLTVTPMTPGGARWNGGQPTNMVVNRNHIWKNPWWQVQWSGGSKDYIEVKSCINCSYTGNIFEGACSGSIAFEVAQTGSNGSTPWNTVKNNVFTNNLLLGDANSVFNALNGAQGSDGFQTSNVQGADIIITNNLWQRVISACGNNPHNSGFMQTAAGTNVLFAHNTIRNVNTVDPIYNSGSGTIMNGQHMGQTNLTVRDNIFNYGSSGFNYNSPAGYQGAWPPNGIIEQKNIVIINGNLTNDPTGPGQVPLSYRVANDAAVGFVNVGSADEGGDYHGYALASNSPFKGQASDGTDPGVNFAALDAALGGSSSTGPQAPTNLRVQ